MEEEAPLPGEGDGAGCRLERSPDVLLLGSSVPYRGRIFDVARERVRLPSGLEQDVEVVVHGGAVAIAALDPSGRMILVRQYRHAIGDWILEIPAGRLEPGEDPRTAAVRELEEETGYESDDWSLLSIFFPAPGFCSERMSLFLARDARPLTRDRRPHDEDEELDLHLAAPERVIELVRDAKSIVAASLLLRGTPGARE